MKKAVFRVVLLALVAGGGWALWKYVLSSSAKQQNIATTRVRKSEVVVRAYTRGELRAVRQATLTAPNLFSTVQVTRLAPLGALAKEKDLVVEFDDSERRAALEETLLEVEQIDEQLKKAVADLAIRNNSDQVELLRARYGVRRAELEVKRNELLPEIDQKKNLLNLEEARRRLKQLESDIQSRQAQAEAELSVLRERRNKSMIDLDREKQRIKQTKVLSPMTGLVAIRQNRSGGGMFGQQVPDIREGDTLQPGMQVADVLDLSEMEVIAKVGELDRANLSEQQEVNLQLDAIPEKIFKGKIKSLSATATSNPFMGDPGKKFDVVFSLDMEQLMRGLGATDEQVRRVLETAVLNAKKAPPPAFPMMALMGGGPPGGMGGGGMASGGGMPGGGSGMQGGIGAPPGGGKPGGGMPSGMAGGMPGGRPGGGGGGGGFAAMTPEQRRAIFQQMMERLPDNVRKELQKELKGRKMEDLSQEDRTKIFAKMRELMGGQGGFPGGGRQGGGGGGGNRQASAPRLPQGTPLTFPALNLPKATGITPTEEEEMAKSKLPVPPEENSQLDILLRPGLLADVEIIVEKIPNAINIPAQAVFEKDGKMFVYVQTRPNSFERRFIQPAKRSESIMVIASGLKPGEVIALADPTAPEGGRKKGDKGGAAPQPKAMPGGMGSGRGAR
ncbi:MAG: efflux RND transporter periplasmic adaptor subunit [Bryobacteraceae bacterium]